MEKIDIVKDNKLPVTLLSGFLGSGKSTLLEHILRNKEGLRCAVIVNDMAELNIDATVLSNKSVLQREEKLVQLQNGCICCTLREDLLEEVAKLAKDGNFDYLVIESTGISEPMQVAETFTFSSEDINSILEMNNSTKQLKPLHNLARLDTCVTVIDAVNFLSTFDTFLTVQETQKDTAPDDERNIVDLMVDQIEFSNVIIINKTDLVDEVEKNKIAEFIKVLNPSAEIITTSYAKVELSKILNTNKFDMDVASQSAGWLQSLTERHNPETLEYGISSFIYRARRPFHTTRLDELIVSSFVLEQFEEVEGDDDDGDDEKRENPEALEILNDNERKNEKEEVVEGSANSNIILPTSASDETKRWREERLQKKKEGPFAGILRSKGFVWLCTRNAIFGEWSQAGVMLAFKCGSVWFAETPEELWPASKLLQSDFQGEFGDRRQEIVFIGIDFDKQKIIDALDRCLLTDDEYATFVANGGFFECKDEFSKWPNPEDLIADMTGVDVEIVEGDDE